MCLSLFSPQGGFTVAANDRFEAFFQKKAADMIREKDVRKMNTVYTAAALFAPEDRELYLRLMVRVMSTRSTERVVVIVKMFDWRIKLPRLVIFTTWQERLPDGSLASVQRFEAAPASRHLNEVPKFVCVINKFRAIPPGADVSRDAAPAGAAGEAEAAAEGGMVVENEEKEEKKTGERVTRMTLLHRAKGI